MAKGVKLPNIVGLGEVVSDILPDSRKLGGAPADFLRHAVKNGANGYLISAIGADDLGREILAELKKININPVMAITPYPTGRVLIFNNASRGYTAHILENAAWDYIPFTTAAEECIKKADAIYFGTLALRKTYSENTILDLIDIAPKNAYKFFDVNLRQNYYTKDIIKKLLARANILKFNIDELKVLKDFLELSGSLENVCLKLKDEYQLKYVIFSNGAKENYIFGDEITTFQNSRLQQTFAIGAGNAFSGTFMSSILMGNSQKIAHQTANDTAVEMCRTFQNS